MPTDWKLCRGTVLVTLSASSFRILDQFSCCRSIQATCLKFNMGQPIQMKRQKFLVRTLSIYLDVELHGQNSQHDLLLQYYSLKNRTVLNLFWAEIGEATRAFNWSDAVNKSLYFVNWGVPRPTVHSERTCQWATWCWFNFLQHMYSRECCYWHWFTCTTCSSSLWQNGTGQSLNTLFQAPAFQVCCFQFLRCQKLQTL